MRGGGSRRDMRERLVALTDQNKQDSARIHQLSQENDRLRRELDGAYKTTGQTAVSLVLSEKKRRDLISTCNRYVTALEAIHAGAELNLPIWSAETAHLALDMQ